VAKEAMRLASHKLPVPTKFLVKESGVLVGSEK
jgi:ribosomal protein L16/L10AE